MNELTAILLEVSGLSEAKGCKLYVIGKYDNEPNLVYITEIWDNKDDLDNSLKMESVRELIMKVMPFFGRTTLERTRNGNYRRNWNIKTDSR